MAKSKAAACITGRLGDDSNDFSDDELEEIIEVLEGRRAQRRDAGIFDNEGRRLFGDAANEAHNMRLKAAVKKREAVLFAKVLAEGRNTIASFSTGKSTAGTDAKPKETVRMIGGKKVVERAPGGMNDVLGFEALIASSNRRVKNARSSIQSMISGRRRKHIMAMNAELEQGGLLPYLQGRKVAGVGIGPGLLDDQLAMELAELSKRERGKPGISESPEALRAAEIIHKYMDLSRIDQNRQGAFIESLYDYIANQSHDAGRLRRSGFQKWRADLFAFKIDLARTFSPEFMAKADIHKVDEALRGIYDGRAAEIGVGDDLPVMVVDKGVNEAQKVSHRKVIHFEDSSGFVNYNKAYGRGSVLDAVMATLERGAHTAALMERAGPNPRKTLETLRGELIQLNRADPKVVQALQSKGIDALIDVATGATDRVSSPFWAGLGQGLRMWQSMSKLGAALLSSVTTDPIMQMGRLTYNGVNVFDAMRASTVDLLKANRPAARHLGFALRSVQSDLVSRFHGGEDFLGGLGKASRMFWWGTGMDFWDRLRQRGFIAAIGNHLYSVRETSWADLNGDLRSTLGTYGYTEAEWNLTRRYSALEKEDDGEIEGVLTPELLKRIPNIELVPLLDGKKPTPAALSRARDRLENMLNTYYADQLDWALMKPGIREKALTTLGAQRGTAVGELARDFFLFKSYPLQMYQRVMGFYTQEDHHLAIAKGAFAMPKSDMVRLAGMVAALVIGGYGSTVLKDISKGRQPRDPRDPKTWGAAFIQGGGAGIYGDFLFGLKSRYGTGPLSQLAGPIAADAEALIDTRDALYDLIWSKDREKAGDKLAADLYYFAKQDTPGINTFYTRAALDYLILYRVQEMLNPGSLRRMERKLKTESDQEFLLPPSEVVN